ncbi:MAG TPA: hypothetical protein GX528_07760 [Firmicutes bacterium]|nr:hypothetical protein [Bacillota bacterium]
MSKLINQPVELINRNGFPFYFYFKRPYYIKYILRHWREAGQWWLGEDELFVYEVSTNHCWCELHHSPRQKQWILYRLAD